MSKDLEMDDLVWAKMKGYPYWPGKIMAPPADAKPRKNHHYVYFFGSLNHAWIADEFIELHSEKMLEKYGQRKGEFFRKAVETIVSDSKHHTPTRITASPSKAGENEKKVDKISKGEAQPKSKSSQNNSARQKFKKKFSIKKVKTPSVEKKQFSRKCPYSSDLPENYSRSFGIDNADSSFSLDNFYTIQPQTSTPPVKHKCDNLKKKSRLSERGYVNRSKTPPVDLTHKNINLEKKNVEPTRKKIGFLGLSKVGQGIIKNLYHTGHSVIIWNQIPEECKKFAEEFKIKIANTPADVVEAADLIFCFMPDSEAVKEVIEGKSGILEGLERFRESKGYIEMTSLDPKMSQEIGNKIRVNGGCYLEAPLCGSRIEAVDGSLLIVAAGDKTVYDDCRSCFEAISKKHMFVSPEVGAASKLNVVHNMFIGTVYASLAEALSLLDKTGLKGTDLHEILQMGALNSKCMLDKLKSMVGQDYVTDTSVKQMQQDFNVGLALGHEISQRTMLFASANEVYKRCMALKYGNHDVSAVFEGTSS